MSEALEVTEIWVRAIAPDIVAVAMVWGEKFKGDTPLWEAQILSDWRAKLDATLSTTAKWFRATLRRRYSRTSPKSITGGPMRRRPTMKRELDGRTWDEMPDWRSRDV